MSTSTGEAKKGRFSRTKKSRENAKGFLSNIKQLYTMTAKADPWLPWLLIPVGLAIVAICLLIGWLWGEGSVSYLVYMGLIGIPLALLACVLLLVWRAKKAAYKQIEGMPGASLAALQELGRGWSFEEQPVAHEAAGKVRGMKDMSNAAMVFRAVGRPGVVLVCEGPAGAAQRLAAAERKHIARVVGDKVPVEVYRVGTDAQGLSAMDIPKRAKKLPNALTKEEVSVVAMRLKSLGSGRPPIPAGMDPRNMRRPSRKGMRGR